MLLPLQGVNAVVIHNPGCRFACPGLGAPLGFQPALAKSETSVSLFFVYKSPTIFIQKEFRYHTDTIPKAQHSKKSRFLGVKIVSDF